MIGDDDHNHHAPPASSVARGAFVVPLPATAYTLTLEAGEINDRALVIDTETTGRGVTAEVVEVAVCNLSGEALFSSLVRPTSKVPRSAARIHGLTTGDVVQAPVWDEVWARLEPLLKGRLLIAYNAPFDRRMIEAMCAYYRLPRPGYLQWRCAMRFVRERGGWKRAPTLTEACHRYGVTPGTHRALTDAQATAFILQRINDR